MGRRVPRPILWCIFLLVSALVQLGWVACKSEVPTPPSQSAATPPSHGAATSPSQGATYPSQSGVVPAECGDIADQSNVVKLGFFRELTPDGDFGSWKRIGSPTETMAVNELTLFRKGDRSVSAVFNEATPSGDWKLRSTYCFRGDEARSLSILFSELRSFYGNVLIKTRHEYDAAGKEIGVKREVLDLETGEPVDRDVMEKTSTVYGNEKIMIEKLGISSLLSKLTP